MKNSDRKRLLTDVTEAQDRYGLEVVSDRGEKFRISKEKDHFRSLNGAVAFLRQQGWKCTEITNEGSIPTYLVGG